MDFTSGQYAQLIIALGLGVTIFLIAYAAPTRYVIGVLVATVPYQAIDSAYGSANMVFIYLVGAAMFFKGRIRKFPLALPMALIMLAYLISFTQTPRPTYLDHALYLIGFGSNIILFYMVYNFFVEDEVRVQTAFNIMLWTSALLAAYCVAQLFIGFEGFSLFGISELSLRGNLERSKRLVGPFNAAGVNGAFFAMQFPIIGYIFLHTRRRIAQIFLMFLAFATFGFLVGTGSRGSFLTAIGAIALFFFVFRREIGAARLLQMSVIGFLGLSVSAVLVVNYTEFNVLFDRLAATRFEGALPETRVAVFEESVKRIPEALVVGHGPRLRLINESERRIAGQSIVGHPHNLYLFLLYTVGTVGLLAYLYFFLSLALRYWGAIRTRVGEDVIRGMPKLGFVLLVVFLVDELKIEFLRASLLDFQHYIFALWAMFLAFGDRILVQASALAKDRRAEIVAGLRSGQSGARGLARRGGLGDGA